MKAFIQHVLILTEKDLQLELRSKETLFSTALFVTLALFIFGFSLGLDVGNNSNLAPGILWVVVTFAGTLALSYLSSRDTEEGTSEGLLMTGCGGLALFFSKFMTVLFFMTGIEIITLLLLVVFFGFSYGQNVQLLGMVISLGTIGFASVGTLFSSLLGKTRLKNLLLPVVLYPVLIPLLIAAVRATTNFMQGNESQGEVALLFGFDIVFLTASALLFELVVEEPT